MEATMEMNSVSTIKAYFEGEFDGGPGRKVDMAEFRALGDCRAELAAMCAARMTSLGSPVEIKAA